MHKNMYAHILSRTHAGQASRHEEHNSTLTRQHVVQYVVIQCDLRVVKHGVGVECCGGGSKSHFETTCVDRDAEDGW